jgi:hypothetical protein
MEKDAEMERSGSPGRPRYALSEAHRRIARAMAAYGVPQVEIARSIGVSAPTLRLYYAQELATGGTEAIAKVAESLFRKALGTTPQSVTAAIFWLKCRAGWRDQPGEPGKKAQAMAEAKRAGTASDWGDDLVSPIRFDG